MDHPEEQHSDDSFEEELEEQPQQQRRGSRGINKKLKESTPREITFNEFQQPAGAKFVTFSNQAGIITRNNVKIIIADWRKVPAEVKDIVWHEIKRDYHIEDDDAKGKVLLQCCAAWKRFKTMLRKKYMDTGKDPCEDYGIEKEDWAKFVAFENTPARREMRVIGRKRALMKKIQTHLGPRGYRGWEDAWLAESDAYRKKKQDEDGDVNASGKKKKDEEGDVDKIHRLYDPRARRFFLARVVKNAKGGYIPITLSKYLDRLLQLDGQLQSGHLELPVGQDLLWYVIGREHWGQCRGVGYTVGIREGIVNYKETRKRMTKDQMRDQVIAKIKGRMKTVEDVVAVMRSQTCTTEEEGSGSPMLRSCGSMLFGDDDDTQEPKRCSLLLPHVEEEDITCARGLVYASRTLHGKPIRDGYAKVQVDSVEPEYLTFIVPVKVQDEVSQLQDAVGSFIQWPKKAISIHQAFTGPSPTSGRRDVGPSSRPSSSGMPSKRVRSGASLSSTSRRKKKEIEMTPSDEAWEDRLSEYSFKILNRPPYMQEYYTNRMQRRNPYVQKTLRLSADTFMMPEDFDVPINAEEIMQLLTQGDVDVYYNTL